MTVGQMIEKLKEYPKDAPLEVTWEGIFRNPSVYLYKDGKTVLIDADDDAYRYCFEHNFNGIPPPYVLRQQLKDWQKITGGKCFIGK